MFWKQYSKYILKMKLDSVLICKRNPKLLQKQCPYSKLRVTILVDMLPGSSLRNSTKYRLKFRDDDNVSTRRHGKSVFKILYILVLEGYWKKKIVVFVSPRNYVQYSYS